MPKPSNKFRNNHAHQSNNQGTHLEGRYARDETEAYFAVKNQQRVAKDLKNEELRAERRQVPITLPKVPYSTVLGR